MGSQDAPALHGHRRWGPANQPWTSLLGGSYADSVYWNHIDGALQLSTCALAHASEVAACPQSCNTVRIKTAAPLGSGFYFGLAMESEPRIVVGPVRREHPAREKS